MIRIDPERVRAVLLADEAIAWARITSHMEIQRMNDSKRPLDYIDLHPEPVQRDTEPPTWLICIGAAVGIVAFCALVAILFAMVGGS